MSFLSISPTVQNNYVGGSTISVFEVGFLNRIWLVRYFQNNPSTGMTGSVFAHLSTVGWSLAGIVFWPRWVVTGCNMIRSAYLALRLTFITMFANVLVWVCAVKAESFFKQEVFSLTEIELAKFLAIFKIMRLSSVIWAECCIGSWRCTKTIRSGWWLRVFWDTLCWTRFSIRWRLSC